MSETTAPRPKTADEPVAVGYWTLAKRPLHILAFLLPLIIAYEISLALLLNLDVEAHRRLGELFERLGVTPTGGLYLGGLVILVVLLVWHVLERHPWRLELGILPVMVVESLLLAAPLVILSHLISVGPAPAATGIPEPALADLDVWSKIAIGVGAGLYEELAFRMLAIAVIHTLLVDLAKLPHWLGGLIAVALSAAAFTAYHDLDNASGGISSRRVLFYFLAGLYLGAVYICRGFGIVVGVHALYDIVIVVLEAIGETD